MRRGRKLVLSALCAGVIGVSGVGSALAGEVNGNGDQTAARTNSNSICSYSGQNDGNPPGGRTQNYGQNVKAGRNDPSHGGFNPGDACQGDTNPNRDK